MASSYQRDDKEAKGWVIDIPGVIGNNFPADYKGSVSGDIGIFMVNAEIAFQLKRIADALESMKKTG